MTSEQIQQRDRELRKDGYIAADVAGWLLGSGEAASEHYCALWVQRSSEDEDARMFVGNEFLSIPNSLEQADEGYMGTTIHHFLAADGRNRYCQVFRPHTQAAAIRLKQEEYRFNSAIASGQILQDLSLALMEPVYFDTEYYQRELTRTERELTVDPKNRTALVERGIARYGLNRIETAIDDFNRAVELDANASDAFLYRALCHARLGNHESAAADGKSYARIKTYPASAAYIEAVLALYKGDRQGTELYHKHVKNKQEDLIWSYNAVCVDTEAAMVFAADAELAAKFANSAIESMRRLVKSGFQNSSFIWKDSSFDLIRKTDDFFRLMEEGRMAWSIASVLSAGDDIETAEVHGVNSDDHLAKCRSLAADGYRPVAIAAAPGSRMTKGHYWMGSVWHRPRGTEQEQKVDSFRRAQAAIALLRQGERERILDVLRISVNPESMTQFIHNCRSRGVWASDLWHCVGVVNANRQSLAGESKKVEDRALYALLLALGDYAPKDLPEEQRAVAIQTLGDWYRNDPSSAVHGATGWLLRKWGEDQRARAVDETPLPYDPKREWLNLVIRAEDRTFNQTYIVVPAGEYLLGSPMYLPEYNDNLVQYRARITRPYAILDREITRYEYEAFDPTIRKRTSGRISLPRHPASPVLWYEGVRFCRWLGERLDLSEEQQAYGEPEMLLKKRRMAPDPTVTFGNNPLNWPVDLKKPGFRLPTVAEWEIAERGGMQSTYFHGSDADLLLHYAWHNSHGITSPRPPRELRPNAYGIFDLAGNLNEWCHDWAFANPVELVNNDPKGPSTGTHRAYRSGEYRGSAAQCRSAWRNGYTPTAPSAVMGLRPVFTLPVPKFSPE